MSTVPISRVHSVCPPEPPPAARQPIRGRRFRPAEHFPGGAKQAYPHRLRHIPLVNRSERGRSCDQKRRLCQNAITNRHEQNGWDDAYTGESEISPPDSLRVFSARSAKEVLCYRDDKKSPEEGACCDGIRSDNCVTKYRYSDRCIVRLCLLERPGQRDGDVRSTNSVNDWGLAHSFTISWCTNIADSSKVAVCYECL